jgi:diguanylate cyclase (GGDEF)-like protein
MLAAYARPDDLPRRSRQERKCLLHSSSSSECTPRRLLSNPLILSVILSGLLSLSSNAAAQSSNPQLQLASADHIAATVDSAHSQLRTAHPRPLIEEVRFNQRPLSFDHGAVAGPGAGDLEIQFAPPESAAPDHLRYRLLGLDSSWAEAGKEREAIYYRLPPGDYLFEFEQTENASVRGSGMASLQITVIPPYWQTGWFRSLCGILLVALVLALYWLRIRYLVRHARRLEEKVNQTKAELQLAVKVAGDAQRALKDQALKDSLTSLWNRRAIFEMLEKEVSRAQRDHLPITLVMIDLDHFKLVNDTYGHLTGDAVLQEAARRISEVMRPYDFAGRYGGEEFLIVLPGCSPSNGIQRAEDFRRALADTPVQTAFGALTITCSLGVAAYDEAMPTEDLIHQADEALYRAKRMGRNCVCAGIPEPTPADGTAVGAATTAPAR